MTTFDNIPDVPHFAIITTESVTIPGDERSRTHPGHGYPEHTVSYINYEMFTDEQKWKDKIAYLVNRPYSKFKAVRVTPAKISVNVDVDVS